MQILRCVFCNERVWPWQAKTPCIDHVGCVLDHIARKVEG
jgi:hypothetical protein